MKKREFSFPTIIGLVVTMVGLVSGLVLLRNPLLSLVSASAEEAPAKVQITNITDTEFAVSWVTTKATSGYIKYGEGNPELVVSDDRDQERGAVGNYFTHYVTVKGLTPQTTYAFTIGSGRGQYDLQGSSYTATTGPQLRNPPGADVAYGQVAAPSGDAAEGAIVYLRLPGIVPQSALVKSSGSWVVPLSTARTSDLTSFAPYDPENDKLEIMVEAGSLGTAQVVVATADDSPVPTIVLGTNTDHTALAITPTPNTTAASESATTTTTSRFSSDALIPSADATASSLAILTPKLAEEVNSDQPEIIGRGPAGVEIQIEIHSETAITDTIIVGADGTWNYNVPEGLEPGEHTITITAIIDGIVKKVTRSFVVQAAGESNSPAFSATASATLVPSPTPSKTPTPTVKSSPTPTPTTTVRISYPSTESGVPQSGNLTPTLIISILGVILVGAGLFAHKKYI